MMRARVPARMALVAAAGVPVLLLADAYTLHQAARVVAIALLALSVAVLTGQVGLPTLGQVAPYGVGAYTTALLAQAGHTAAPLQLAGAALAAAAFSVLVGTAVVRTRGVVFLMVTLAVGELTVVAAEQWRTVTGGTDGLAGIPATTLWPGGPPLVDDRPVAAYVFAVGLVAVGVVWTLRGRPAGTLLRGVRDNELRMVTSGHRVHGYLLAAYTGTGAFAGIAGSLLVTTQRYVSPADVSFQVSALVLLAVIVGGVHSVTGSLTGAVAVVTVRDWASGAMPGYGPLLLGLIFIVAVYALPGGLAGVRWRPARTRGEA